MRNRANDGEFRGRLAGAVRSFRKLPKPPLGRCMWWRSTCDRTVSSHSVSCAWLETLADEGHVIHFTANVDVAQARADVSAEAIGINSASVFPGFCAEHDSSIFRDIDLPFSECDQRRCDLLAFRSVCREAYTKYKVASFNLSQGMVRDHPTQHGEFTVDMMFCAVDLLAQKDALEEALDRAKPGYCHYAVEFSSTPTVTTCATFSPQVSFDGLPIVGPLEWVTVTILPASFGGLAVFSWDARHSTKAVALLDSLLRIKPEWMSDLLLRYAIDNAENAYYSPSWWRVLAPEQQSEIVQRYKMTLLAPHRLQRGLYSTVGSPLVDWSVRRHYPLK